MTEGRSEAPPRTVRWWHCVLAGLSYAALTALSFPPLSLWWLSFLAPLGPAAIAMARPARPGRAGIWCAVGSLPLWLYEMSWVFRVTAQGFVPVCVYLSLYVWLFVWLFAKVQGRKRGLTVPAGAVLWTALEVVRGEVVWDGYPWYLVSEPFIDAGVLAMPARVVGLYGLSFLVMLFAMALAVAAVRTTERRWAVFTAVGACAAWVVLAALGGRSLPARSAGATGIRVGLVQTNVPSDNKVGWTVEQRLADLTRFETLTRLAGADGPDFIVWPETMFPGRSLDDQAVRAEKAAGIYLLARTAEGERRVSSSEFADRLFELQAQLQIPMVVGAVGVDNLRIGTSPEGRPTFENDGRFNSVFVVDGGRLTGERYDKIALTPFGEYMPYISAWPWLEQRLMSLGAHGMAFDLARGKRREPLLLPVAERVPVSIATPICFEVTKPSACRELASSGRGAELIVNLTNDGWFGDSDKTRLQHLQLARWRSLELGIPMVRAANTGICAVIDPAGRVAASGVKGSAMAARVEGVLIADVGLPGNVRTFFGAHGDVVRWPMLLAGVFVAAFGFARHGRGTGAAEQQG